MNFDSSRHRALRPAIPAFLPCLGATAALLLLAACGGGGGGGSSPATAVTPLALNASNARPAAADALQNIDTATAGGGADLVGSLKVLPAGAAGGAPGLPRIALALAAKASPAPFTKAAVDQTVPCDHGGTLTVRGNVASSDGLVAGDSVSLSASNCSLTIDGSPATLSGGLGIVVNTGSIRGYPFTATLTLIASDLRVQAAGETLTSTGDVRLDWSATGDTAQTLVATGSSFAITKVAGSTTRSSRWQSYRHETVLSGTEARQKLEAAVETLNAGLGSGYAGYQLATPMVVVSTGATGAYTGGTMLLTGRQSALQVLFKAGNAVDLMLDADGNGSYEQTIATTVGELRSLP